MRSCRRPNNIIDSTAIWISDATLQQTFEAFARQRRCLSNIPGPLEAHKRAARRRLTSTRRVDCGYDVLMSETLFYDFIPLPEGRSTQWWDSQTSRHKQEKRKGTWRIWDWWSDPLPTVNRSALFEALTMDQDVLPLIDRSYSPYRDCASVLRLLEERSLALINNPQLARSIFLTGIKQQWELTEISRFLTDPRLNPTGSANYTAFLEECSKNPTMLQLLDPQAILLRAGQLGLVSVREITEILLLPADNATRRHVGEGKWSTFCLHLVQALQESKVFHVKDLPEHLLSTWPQKIEAHVDANTFKLMLLFQFVLDRQLVNSVAKILERVLEWSTTMPETDFAHVKPCLAEFLSTVPNTVVTEALCQQTLQLTTIPDEPRKVDIPDREANSSDKLIDQVFRKSITEFVQTKSVKHEWHELLVYLGSANAESFEVSRDSLYHWINLGLKPLHEYPISEWTRACSTRFLCSVWTMTALLGWREELPGDIAGDDFQSLISAIYEHTSQSTEEDILAMIIDDFTSLKLPVPRHLLKRLTELSGGYIHTTASFETLSEYLAELRSDSIKIFMDGDKFAMALFHFPLGLRKYAEKVNKDLGRFKSMSVLAINQIPGMGRYAFRMLQRNLSLKLALSWRSLGDTRYDGTSETDEGVSLISRELPGNLKGQEAMDMIDSIAWACAKAPYSTPREAWLQVYRVYSFVGSHRNTKQMRRALWYAAAMRPSRPAYIRVQWVFGIIAKHEGRDVAEELVRTTHNLKKSAYLAERVMSSQLEEDDHQQKDRNLKVDEDRSKGAGHRKDECGDSGSTAESWQPMQNS